MIISEKTMFPPPPPYSEVAQSWQPPESSPRPAPRLPAPGTKAASFASIPSQILLQIVYATFPQTDGEFDGESKVQRQRENLFWLETSLRLVNRAFYTACMHVLRATYLPAYASLVRPPYTHNPSMSGHSRELPILDLFIALLAQEDLMLDTSSYHLPRDEAYKDIFDLSQPKSRLEDLVIEEGMNVGVIVDPDRQRASSPARSRRSTSPSSRPSAVPDGITGVAVPVVIPASVPSSSVTTRSSEELEDDGTEVPSSSYSLSCPSQYLLPHRQGTPSPVPSPTPSPTRSSFLKPFAFVSTYRDKRTAKRSSRQPPPPTPFNIHSRSCCRSITPIQSSTITISFSPRVVKLLYSDAPPGPAAAADISGSEFGSYSLSGVSHGVYKKKCLVEISRTKDEKLEVSAQKLVKGLVQVLEDGVI